MKSRLLRQVTLLTAVLFFSAMVAQELEARAGSGRSSGSRGSRTYSTPSRTSSQPSGNYQRQQDNYQQQQAYQQPQPQRGGFLRSMAGGIAGGLLGGLIIHSLFGSSAMAAGTGGAGGSGIGILEILLLVGIGFLVYKLIKKMRQGNSAASSSFQQQEEQAYQPRNIQFGSALQGSDMNEGLNRIRQSDPSFSEERFKDQVMDAFFKIQAGWMNRNLASIQNLLTTEMKSVFEPEIQQLLKDKKINRLENIAVRSVEITEAWQEAGQDYITTLVYANLLDYTTDEKSGKITSGSNSEPVKFEEFWTFTRPAGGNQWQLSGIHQA